MSNRRVFPAFLHFDTEWQQSLRQFKIHFWKTAKRTMSTQLSRGTRSALPSCPCTAKDIGQVPSVLSPLVTPRPLQVLLLCPQPWWTSPGQGSSPTLSSRAQRGEHCAHPAIPMPLQRKKGREDEKRENCCLQFPFIHRSWGVQKANQMS